VQERHSLRDVVIQDRRPNRDDGKSEQRRRKIRKRQCCKRNLQSTVVREKTTDAPESSNGIRDRDLKEHLYPRKEGTSGMFIGKTIGLDIVK
jgi:hypothetical protein